MVVSAGVMMRAVRYVGRDKLSVILLAHARQLLEKTDCRPQLIVTVVVPGRHAGHFDTVLKDPEQLGWSVERRGFGKIWRRRIKASRDIALRDARRAVADRAMRRVMLNADKDFRRVIEPGRHNNAGRLCFD